MNTIAASAGLMAGGVALSAAGGTIIRTIGMDRPDDDPTRGVSGSIALLGGGMVTIAGATLLSTLVKSNSMAAFAGVMAGGVGAGLGAMALGWKLSDAWS